ncbi:LOW QUALITY PROTEIN: RAB11-binding protein RELCH-like [Pecten maximus]|uniref:LOW QUALITY PROTEIN: RAB11-binding protein RELCH-like n=1 Tax=Pecten maximus TaxID=6579 RepID=UPI0014585DDD|nr:LOW QUALITY PROTEIN: RAB11-binding protein RELCH-like [Pecten maximus]
MADNTNTNPFDCDVDPEIIIEEQLDDTENDIVPMEPSESSWDSIAHKLLRENFMLTALEFHTELIESGRELPRLRDYFSNPGNFERTRDDLTSPGLPRTSSIQTFDSLDFARYSDDGAGQVDERVAVLEFELRKAQETIKSLRASLTKEAENECTENVTEGFTQMGKDDPIRPLDKRALNYLVNEYLLMNNYKLTSVTFSEENEDQDFEDWDDVGLNIPRPPDLLHLYKDYGSHVTQEVETSNVECWVNLEEDRIGELEQEWITVKEQLDFQIKELEDQVILIQTEKVDLEHQLSEMSRQMILTGCVAFAQHVGQARLMEELLPQCWEQISHKYAERRILVAEACGALASYLPNEILSSLVLSMLQQMLSDDKDEEVREAVVRSLGLLFGFICDTDKFSQGFELLQTALKDNSERVITAAQQVFLPAFAVWAQELDKLEHNLINTILKDLEELCALAAQKASNSVTIPLNEGRFLLLMMALQELVPFLFISMIKSAPFVSKLSEVLGSAEPVDASRFPKPSSSLSDLKTVVGGGRELSALMSLYENHISQEWFEPWDNFNWVVNNLIPRLIEISMGAGLSAPRITTCQCKCFFKICRTFGKKFTEKKIRPKFIELMMLTDEHVEYQAYANAKQTSVTTCIVPVYAGGVLSAFNSEEDRQQLTQFLQEMLTMVSVYQAPLDSLKAAFTEISANPSNHELLLTVLWEGVVHTSAQVRSTAARLFELLVKGVGENLVSTRVFPALVTLGNDPEISVRTSTIPALGAIIENINLREMLDRVYMQFLTFMDDPAYKDEHNIQTELIRTLARVGPNAEPRFRDEFILPRLAAMASANNNLTTEGRKRDIALLLFEAYSAMSCCFINDQLVQEAMVPGLRCLKQDVAQIAPEHEEVVSSMIKDYESKMESGRPADRSFTPSSAYSMAGTTPMSSEDMKTRMMSRIKDTTSKANLSTIFTRKK